MCFRYDPNHICNHSDDSGRYKYEDQPSICYWNCEKLAVALGSVLNVGRARAELRVNFEQEYDKCASVPTTSASIVASSCFMIKKDLS